MPKPLLDTLYASATKDENVEIALTLLRQPDLRRLEASLIIDVIYKHRKFLDYKEINRILSANSKTTIHELAMNTAPGALRLLGSRFATCFTAIEIANLHKQHCGDKTYFKALRDGHLKSGELVPNLTKILSRARKEGSIADAVKCMSRNPILFGLFRVESKTNMARAVTKVAAAAGGAGTKVSLTLALKK